MEWTRDNFRVTTDISKFNMDFVVTSLQGLWRKGSLRERIEQAFANSLCFGIFDSEQHIGFIRAVTDHSFVSWVCDLYLDPEYRDRGLGKWLMECVKNHPNLVNTKLVFSSMPEAEPFYESIGFKPMERGYAMPPRGTQQSERGDS